jgi:hypothetical protein
MLRIVAALIQSFLLTPIRSLFIGERPEKNAFASASSARKKRRVNAETIQITPCAVRDMTEEGRAIYASCDAVVDGVSYKFDLVHQSGTLDATGRQERPCGHGLECKAHIEPGRQPRLKQCLPICHPIKR